MTEAQRYDVFLSYALADEDWVREFAATLKAAGIRAWSDSEVETGQDWRNQIEDALRNSSIFVLILTPNSVSSPWIFFEVGAAVADHKKVILVLAQDLDASQFPPILKRFHVLKEYSPAKAGLRVAEAIEQIAA